MLLLLASALAACASVPDYREEWFTVPRSALAMCSDPSNFWNNKTGLAVDPFNQTRVSSAQECCDFCANQPSGECGCWTYHQSAHQDGGACFVSKIPVAHESDDAISGMGPYAPPPPPPPKPLPKPNPPLGYQPNFVFVLTDDQDRILGENDYTTIGSLEVMPTLKKRLLGEGSIVENFMVNTPICCPSRTEFFTGRYFHNVGPPGDMDGHCMHVDTSLAGSNATGLFGLMQRAGYQVGLFGKVTNDQGTILKQMVEEEMSTLYIDSPLDYNSFTGDTYYRYWGSNNTQTTEKLDKNNPIFGTDYQSTQIGNRTLRWLEKVAGTENEKPFFAYIGPHAPHYPAQPAPWYEHTFDDKTAPITPNYNLSSPDKANHVAQNPPFIERVQCWENQHFRNRWGTLLSVDDILSDVMDLLDRKGVLDKTFIIYSSDHGYKLGQWRIGTSKQHPYETDIRVPFLIRGPGVKAGGNYTAQISGNVDLTPTMLELAAGKEFVEALDFDGRSMATFLVDGVPSSGQPWRDHFINEYLSVGTYYNDHSSIWQDGKNTTEQCGGDVPQGPGDSKGKCVEQMGVGNGTCYFVDSKFSNNWRQLRINNATMNWNYVEYDPNWTFNKTGIQHAELYDVSADPYQMKNLYKETSAETIDALHEQLEAYFKCKGKSCP